MTLPTIGDGFGRVYQKPIARTETAVGRQEIYTETVVGGKRVTIIVRYDVTPEDVYSNLARAQAYHIATGEPFPAPSVGRDIKDCMIRTNLG